MKRLAPRAVAVVLFLALALVAEWASTQQQFSAADLIDLRAVTGAVISPDGTVIAGMVGRERPEGDDEDGS